MLGTTLLIAQWLAELAGASGLHVLSCRNLAHASGRMFQVQPIEVQGVTAAAGFIFSILAGTVRYSRSAR